MPILNFDGTTFVAFVDICGFKVMMKNKTKAINSLNKFYQSGFDVIRKNKNINGFFLSDCGILFACNMEDNTDKKLISLLTAIKIINTELIRNDIMLTTSIAYGEFKYKQKLEFTGIEKNRIYGDAYVAAYVDTETGVPKIQPGQCRIVPPNEDSNQINSAIGRINNQFGNCLKENNKHYYFYWMVNDNSQIERFENEYKDSYQQKYFGMMSAIKSNLQ